jgi:hypothetical protein
VLIPRADGKVRRLVPSIAHRFAPQTASRRKLRAHCQVEHGGRSEIRGSPADVTPWALSRQGWPAGEVRRRRRANAYNSPYAYTGGEGQEGRRDAVRRRQQRAAGTHAALMRTLAAAHTRRRDSREGNVVRCAAVTAPWCCLAAGQASALTSRVTAPRDRADERGLGPSRGPPLHPRLCPERRAPLRRLGRRQSRRRRLGRPILARLSGGLERAGDGAAPRPPPSMSPPQAPPG